MSNGIECWKCTRIVGALIERPYSGDIPNVLQGAAAELSLLLNQRRRSTVFCRLFVCISPTQQLTVFPRACGELDSEWHSIGMKRTRNDDRRHADGIYPACVAVRSTAWATVGLRNGLII